MRCDNPTCNKEVPERLARRPSRFHHCSRACRYGNPSVMVGRKKGFGPNLENRSSRCCRHCRVEFVPVSLRQQYCRTCVPDSFALGRMQKYSLSRPQYEFLMDKQGHACALCFRSFTSLPRHPDVDHDHVTMRVRGLLCRACNQMMRAVDDKVWLERALAYSRDDNERSTTITSNDTA